MSGKYKISAVVTGLKGKCYKGHKVGDKFNLSHHESEGLCGAFYHDIFPVITLLQYGGVFPWMEGDTVKMECPDRENLLEIELRREKEGSL